MQYRIKLIDGVYYIQRKDFWRTLWFWSDIRIVTGFYDGFASTRRKSFHDLESAVEYVKNLECITPKKSNVTYYYVENGVAFWRDSTGREFPVKV